MHACECNAHKHACTFLYLVSAFNSAEFVDDEENESCSGGSNVYLTMIFTLLYRYVNACEHNAHKSVCMFLYLSIAFTQWIIWGL